MLRLSLEKQCFAAKILLLGNKRQVYKFLNDLSGKVMNSSKVPVLETVANTINQPNAQDNTKAFNNFLPMLDLKSASIWMLKMNVPRPQK